MRFEIRRDLFPLSYEFAKVVSYKTAVTSGADFVVLVGDIKPVRPGDARSFRILRQVPQAWPATYPPNSNLYIAKVKTKPPAPTIARNTNEIAR